MIRSDSSLYFYMCRNCRTTAVAATKAEYGNPYGCVLCRRYMNFIYTMPIETEEQRSWARRGIVYNPGLGKDPSPGSLREIPE